MYPRLLIVCLAGLCCLLPGGCGDSTAQQQLDLAEESVLLALEAWSRGESAGTLAARETPIEFHDDQWQAGLRLIGFRIVKTYHDTDGRPRCTVRLDVQPPDEPVATTQDITYEVNTEPKIVIARDPYS